MLVSVGLTFIMTTDIKVPVQRIFVHYTPTSMDVVGFCAVI